MKHPQNGFAQTKMIKLDFPVMSVVEVWTGCSQVA